ncbi:hypothetical protein MKX01_028914, partial [Papaver californicum]
AEVAWWIRRICYRAGKEKTSLFLIYCCWFRSSLSWYSSKGKWNIKDLSVLRVVQCIYCQHQGYGA